MRHQLVMLNLMLKKDGNKKANYLKKNKVFHYQGDNCFYQPYKIPSEPFLISMHNNVLVAANVTFITHDIVNYMLNKAQEFRAKGRYEFFMGTIEIFDNVMIGANSTIMYNTKIGPNAIVAAGSVVTKDVPEGTIVGGNPAKVIGYVDDLAKKRLKYADIPHRESNKEVIDTYFWDAQ